MIVMSFAAGFAKAEDKPGAVRGSIVTLDLDGARSVIPAAAVTIESAELFRQTSKARSDSAICPPAGIRSGPAPPD